MTTLPLTAVAPGQVKLLPGLLQQRRDLNRRYLMSLKSEHLLQNHYLEAALWNPNGKLTDCHWGWETPTCQVRGHFLGHWLSAAARLWAAEGDAELKAKADCIVAELRRCQEANGGEWAGSIPPSYLQAIAAGRGRWAPHYTLHKTLMGLIDMARFAGSETALRVASDWAAWFHRWTGTFSREQFDDILECETGGMMEAWADLYALTGREEHLDLVRRYERRRLFDRLLAGEDPLTNRHANTTIPEAHGAARAWEVAGVTRWRQAAEAYWHSAVTGRGGYVTGGQTCGEVWSPPFRLAARLGDKTQEHCTVYNLMRLADYLLRWTGAADYADYWERNLYNGILAQQHGGTGMVTYFLPLCPGGAKKWGTPTEDFWCCHGTLVQAHASHDRALYFADAEGLVVAQYVHSECAWQRDGARVVVRQTLDGQAGHIANLTLPLGPPHRPLVCAVDLAVTCDAPREFTLKLRLPWWVTGAARLVVNGEPQVVPRRPSSFAAIRRTWTRDTVRLELPKALTTCPLPDAPTLVAFMEGPVVLAGLCDDERALRGRADRPGELLAPDIEREWGYWRTRYRTVGQGRNLRFVPLHEITDERYTVYFPLTAPAARGEQRAARRSRVRRGTGQRRNRDHA